MEKNEKNKIEWIDILVDEISAVAMLCHADLADHALRVMQGL